jgi:hypothetical protein
MLIVVYLSLCTVRPVTGPEDEGVAFLAVVLVAKSDVVRQIHDWMTS